MSWIVPETVLVSPALYMLAAVAATLLVGFSKGGFGGGVGVLATPILLLAVPGNVALSLLLPLLIVCDFFTLRQFPRHWERRSYWLLLPGTLVGFLFGFAFLIWFARGGEGGAAGERWIRLVVGIVSLLFCGLKAIEPLLRRYGLSDGAAFRPGVGSGIAAGLLAGFTTVVAHAAGAVINMFLLPQRLSSRDFVGTCARYYLTVNALKVPLYVAAGALAERDFITLETLKWDLWLVPLCPLGVAAGAWLNRRMSGPLFTAIVYALLALTGLKMIGDALGG